MTTVPSIEFIFRENSEFVTRSTDELFGDKRVVIFSLPGAFTPTCSAYQLPGFEEKYDEFRSLGIDAIYCISVNDAFVMNAWAKDQGIEKVQLIPDGNGSFTFGMGYLVEKQNVGFGNRSWRYAAVVNNKEVEWIAEESGLDNNISEDPYEQTTPEAVLEYLKSAS
jgi:peroxiredoxin